MIDFADLCARAARLWDVSYDALRSGEGRTQRLTDARQAVAYVLSLHDYTVVEIGLMLNRDHSTICYSLKRARRRIGDEPHFRELVEELQIVPSVPLEPPPPVQRQQPAWSMTPAFRLAVVLYGLATPKAA